MISQETKATILEIQVNAAMSGHDIGPFEPVDTPAAGFEARCRNCDQSVWVGDSGLMYSLLDDFCSSADKPADMPG